MITIDLYYLINVLLPPVHRLEEIIYYLRASIKPLDELLQNFYSFFDAIEYDLQFNGQVIMLEHLLNDKFDNVDRGIYITDAVNVGNLFLFNKTEDNEQTFLFNSDEEETPTYLKNRAEIQNFDFIVNVPAAVTFNEDQLKFYVNKYRCFGKRWKIEII